MKTVSRSEILDLGAYEEIRGPFRRRVIEEKKRRRVGLGPNMTAVFENHDTVLFQIQEMLRTERITKEAAIEHELETYNELVPAENELSITVFVEYPDADERKRMLVALAGLESRFYVTVDGTRFPIRNETRGTIAEQTTAVHYTKAPLRPDAAQAIARGEARVVLGVDHPEYRAETVLGPATLDSLAEDVR